MLCTMKGTVTGSEVTRSGKGSMVGILQDVNGKQAWIRVYTEKTPPKPGEKIEAVVRISGKDFMVSMV